MKKLPLKNTETQKIPVGPRLQKELRVRKNIKVNEQNKQCDGFQKLENLDKPSTFTTDKLKKSIKELEKKEPNLQQLLEEKLASPCTAKYVRKKKASKVTVLESRKIYQDLVSLDVSGTNLIKGIEEDLLRRACVVQPQPLPQDPEPQIEDYFKEEDFINIRTVGQSDIFPLSPTRNPFRTDESILKKYVDTIIS